MLITLFDRNQRLSVCVGGSTFGLDYRLHLRLNQGAAACYGEDFG